jgi:hypothetical protein
LFSGVFRDDGPEQSRCRASAQKPVQFRCRLFPLISCQIPLFGGTANLASDSNEINYFEASGWACDRPEWALFPAFSEEQGIRSLSSDRRRGKFW